MPLPSPQQVALRDGRRVLMRPFSSNDTQALWELFQRLPEASRRLAWDRIDDRGVVESWGRNINYDKVFPLLAVDGARIVADATLHMRPGGPLRFAGRMKWLIDPQWRGVGLGTVLVQQICGLARRNGLRHLACMLVTDLEADAIQTLLGLGFVAHVIPGYGADPDGGAHDMTLLTLKL